MAKHTAASTANAVVALCNEFGDTITNLKLQKILYYAQGWHLGLYGEPLFDDRIEAWVHGPVVPSVYRQFKDFAHRPIDLPDAKWEAVPVDLREHIADVWQAYGRLTAYDLERLSHEERPWLVARGGIAADEVSRAEVSRDEMLAFFREKHANGD